MNTRQQLLVLAILLLIYAFLTFITVMFFQEARQASVQAPAPPAGPGWPTWLLAVANAGIVLVAYGLFGLAGFWLARKLGLPGVFRGGLHPPELPFLDHRLGHSWHWRGDPVPHVRHIGSE